MILVRPDLGRKNELTLSKFYLTSSCMHICKSWIYIEAVRSRISTVPTWRAHIQCFVKTESDKSTVICCYNIETEFSKSTGQFSKSNDSPRIKCFQIRQTYSSFCIFIFHHEAIITAGSFVVLTVAERVAFIIFLFISWSSSINYSHSQLTGSASSKKIRLHWNNFILRVKNLTLPRARPVFEFKIKILVN